MLDPSQFVPEPDERVFRLPSSAATSGLLWLLGGIAAFAMSGVGFVVAILAQVNQFQLQMMTTLPVLIGVGAFASAWMTARTPRAVAVGPKGVRIVSRHESRTHGWDEIGWSAVQPGPLSKRRQLKIYDVKGGILAKLSDAIENFDELADLVEFRITAKPDATAGRIQLAKSKRQAIFITATGVGLLVLAGGVAWMTHSDARAARLLEESAVPGEAHIEDRFLAPNGVTPRLVYRITTADGQTATRNAQVERFVWDRLEGAKTVAVNYVPDEPSISRLAFGEPENRDPLKSPLGGYALSAIAAVMSLLLLVCGPLLWFGWSIDLDSRTRRFSIKRFGTGR